MSSKVVIVEIMSCFARFFVVSAGEFVKKTVFGLAFCVRFGIMNNEIGGLVYNDVKWDFSNEKLKMMLSHLVGYAKANFFRQLAFFGQA